METYFVDIGRGTSNLILIGQQKAIVLDCGQNSLALLQLLSQLKIDTISQLIISHSHHDHIGGALTLLTQYEGRIDKLYFVQDDTLLKSRFLVKLMQHIDKGRILASQVFRLECDSTPRLLFQSPNNEITIKAFSPNFTDNLRALNSKNPNATSGVLVLDSKGKRIVFAGDSTVEQWRQIRAARGRPLECDVLAVPHHAGVVWANINELDWLYKEGVVPRHSIISVSTSNTDKHPLPEVITALARAGSSIACTQITRQCCNNLEDLRPGVLLPILPGRSSKAKDCTSTGRSRNVACAGTVLAELSGSVLKLHRLDEHNQAVNQLASATSGHPLCR